MNGEWEMVTGRKTTARTNRSKMEKGNGSSYEAETFNI
jgi:hypothetical protein